MEYITNPIPSYKLLLKLNKKFGNYDWHQSLSNSSYSLIANMENYQDYPQYYDFNHVDGDEYVIEQRNGRIANIFKVNEIDDQECSLHEIFLATAHQWTNGVQKAGLEIYFLE